MSHVLRAEVASPGGKLKNYSVRVLKIDRPHEDTFVQIWRHAPLGFVMVDHLRTVDAGIAKAGNETVDGFAVDVEGQVVHGAVR